jgi:succinate dehydrogenase / fumarate reductase membrane anchor subunit
MNSKKSIQSPLGRAKGLGSTHEGVHHWMAERVSAVTSLGLMIWLVWAMVNMQDWSYAAFTSWLAQPVNAFLMILTIISTFYHAAFGTQVILEDYVHNEAWKIIQVTGLKLAFLALALASIFAILKISFGG